MTRSRDSELGPPIPVARWACGHRASPIITGCWQLASDHGATVPDFADLCGRWERGVEAGLTTFDCADIYTGVEELLGRFGRWLGRPQALQFHTKFVPDRSQLADLDRARVEQVIDRSLRRLGREALDLVQFHWWDYGVPGYVETALWLDELRRAGKIRHVGLTNFDFDHVREIVAAGVSVASVQVQYSVLDRRPAARLAPWCREHGIELLSYGGLAGGFLTESYLSTRTPGGALANRSLSKYRLIIDEFGGWEAFQEVLTTLDEMSQRKGVSVATTVLRWLLNREGVSGVIVGAGRRNRLADYRAVFDEDWAPEDWSELERLLARRPGPGGFVYEAERTQGGAHMKILRMNLQRGDGEGRTDEA